MPYRRAVTARVEPLEPRALLSAVLPTDHEQYLLELVNRARANPSAEAARYGIDLNEGLAPNTISTAAKQPLAMNPYLVDAARGHSQWMIDNDVFQHDGAGGSAPWDRMAAAGYAAAGTFGAGENIAYRGQKPGTPPPTATTAAEHQDLFVDAGIAGRGHRTNMMSAAFKEVGVGIATGVFQTYNALMSDEDFAYRPGDSFLTGVAYADAVTADQFYTPGEGLGAVTITAVRSGGGTYTTTTWSTGGYSLRVPAGTYTVTASGGELGTTQTYTNIAVGSVNVKLDVLPGGGTTTPDPTPVPPVPPVPPPPLPPPPPPPAVVDPTTDGGDGGTTDGGDPTPTIPPPPPPPTGTVKGSVWYDVNGNGKRDKREPALAGLTAFLDLDGDGARGDAEPTTTTAADGSYAFAGLEAGGYAVRVEAATGWRPTTAEAPVAEAGVTSRRPAKAKPIGLTDTVAVGGTLFADADANGAMEAGELPFRKAKLFLDLNNDGVRQKSEPTAKVGKQGEWKFVGLAPGVYTVRVIVKPTFAVTTPVGGALTVDASTPATDSLLNLIGVGLA